MSATDFFTTQQPTWTQWRRDLHKHPDLADQEHRTAEFVVERSTQMGVEVHRGYGRTGNVGVQCLATLVEGAKR